MQLVDWTIAQDPHKFSDFSKSFAEFGFFFDELGRKPTRPSSRTLKERLMYASNAVGCFGQLKRVQKDPLDSP